MILAAGLGTRMAPLTDQRAKPALRLFDLPLIAWPMACLARNGVKRLVVNLHHLPETLEPQLVRFSRRLGLDLRLSYESGEILGTGGGVGAAAPLLLESGPGTMLLLNADSLFLGDLAAACEDHRVAGREASMLLRRPPAGGRYGLVQTAGDGRVISIVGKPEPAETPANQWMFIGIHVFEPGLLRRIPAGRAVDINTEVYRGMIRSGVALGGIPVNGPWLDFGTPRQFLDSTMTLLASRTAEEGGMPLPLEPPGRFEAVGPSYVGQGTDISTGTRLQWAVVGEGGTVGSGCSLVRCLLMEECRLGGAVDLEDCLVGPGTVIPDRFTARGELLSSGPDGGLPDRRPLAPISHRPSATEPDTQ